MYMPKFFDQEHEPDKKNGMTMVFFPIELNKNFE